MNNDNFLKTKILIFGLILWNGIDIFFPRCVSSLSCEDTKMQEFCLSANYSNAGEILERRGRSKSLLSIKEIRQKEMKGFGDFDFEKYDQSLAESLTNLILREMESCSITIAYEDFFSDSFTLEALVSLPNTKQVARIISKESFDHLQWESSLCSGFIFLLVEGAAVSEYMNIERKNYNYHGKYVLVAPHTELLFNITISKKGRKTEHIVGFVPSSFKSHWMIYVKKFAASPPMKQFSLKERMKDDVIFRDIMKDLNGAELKLVTFEWRPSVFYDYDSEGNVIDYYGIDISVVKTLSLLLNFSIVYVEPPPNEYFGGRTDNGSWTGLVGMIARNEADMAVVDLFFISTRHEVVDFAGPFAVEASCLLGRVASPLPQWQSLTFPFNTQAWLALLICLVICLVTMYCLTFINWKLDNGESTKKPDIMDVFIPFEAHVRQSSWEANIYQRLGIRIFFAFLWLYCIILTSAYSSNLTAFLTVQRLPPTFETIEELKETNLLVGGLGPFYSSDTDSDELKFLQSRYTVLSSRSEQVRKVMDNKIVGVMDRKSIQYARATTFYEGQKDPKKNLRMLKECLLFFPNGMYVQKNSILKRSFDKWILRMVQSGLVGKWFFDAIFLSDQKKMEKKLREGNDKVKPEETTQSESKVVSLGLSHLQGIFFITLIGYFFGFIVFVVELLYAHYNSH